MGRRGRCVEIDASSNQTVSPRLQSFGCDGNRFVEVLFRVDPSIPPLSDHDSTPSSLLPRLRRQQGCWRSSVCVRWFRVGTGAQMFPEKLILKFSCHEQAAAALQFMTVLIRDDGVCSPSQQSLVFVWWGCQQRVQFLVQSQWKAWNVIVQITTTTILLLLSAFQNISMKISTSLSRSTSDLLSWTNPR